MVQDLPELNEGQLVVINASKVIVPSLPVRIDAVWRRWRRLLRWWVVRKCIRMPLFLLTRLVSAMMMFGHRTRVSGTLDRNEVTIGRSFLYTLRILEKVVSVAKPSILWNRAMWYVHSAARGMDATDSSRVLIKDDVCHRVIAVW